MNDIHKLPDDLAAYQSAQKEDEQHLTFHGEWSPFSNFHTSRFMVDGKLYHCAEQWIQEQKSLLFNDLETARQIMDAASPYECKRLGYQVQGFDMTRWRVDGYELCLKGIRNKFIQNPPLLGMLKATHPKILIESTSDKLWGTGVQLKDPDALNPEKWHNTGWMSSMLTTIRDHQHDKIN